MWEKLKTNNITSYNYVNQIKNYSIRIGERLYKRITKHIQLLKHLKITQNKQRWVERAILEKIERDEKQEIIECISPEKHLSFKISSHIDAKVEKRVEVIKKLRGSFSKKQWILEAIYEKLEMEEKETEQKTKEMFQKMLKTTSETHDAYYK